MEYGILDLLDGVEIGEHDVCERVGDKAGNDDVLTPKSAKLETWRELIQMLQ